MAIRAVLFDIGGVVELTPATHWAQRWSDLLGIRVEELRRRLQPAGRAGMLGTISLETYERTVASTLGLDAAQLRAFMDDIWAEYLGTLNEPLVAHIATLRDRYTIGALSNSFVGAREREQAAYAFDSLFDVILYSHEIGVKKPDARAFVAACLALHAEPHEVVFVDDLASNVVAARELGMAAIEFRDTDEAIDELTEVLEVAVH